MINVQKIGLCLTIVLGCSFATAETAVARKVKYAGCHNTDGTCYVQLEGPAFGSSQNCAVKPTNEFRFDNGDTVIGRRAYASFLSALISGRLVTVTVNGCSRQGWPQLQYFHIE